MEITVSNPFSADYPDTLFVGETARINVHVDDKDGKPLSGKPVQLSKTVIDPGEKRNGADDYYSDAFTILNDPVQTTDAKGNAVFLFGIGKAKDDAGAIDSTSTRYVSSFRLTASAYGHSALQASTEVRFSALCIGGGITLAQDYDGGKPVTLAPGINQSMMDTDLFSAVNTHDGTGHPVQYLTSQQVSSDNTDHSVAFTSGTAGLSLMLPGSRQLESPPEAIEETINYDTGKYSTYNTSAKWAKVIDSTSITELQYATVNFGKLSLSKYSTFTVRAYLVTDKNNPENSAIPIALDDSGAYAAGEKISRGFSVQIPLHDTESVQEGYLYITAKISSRGQVDMAVNDGFTVKSVTGIKKKTVSSIQPAAPVSVEGVSVEWAKDKDAAYTLDKELSEEKHAPIIDFLDNVTSQDGTKKYQNCTYTYKVPAFPRTGNGIITISDSKGTELAHYAIPAVNATETRSGDIVYLNQNILSTDPRMMYKISCDEAHHFVGTVRTDQDGHAVVNSEQTGITHLIGTITSNNEKIKIDAENKRIYTSVHWNPVPSHADASEKRTIGAALIGQQITVKAQLTDKNGNPVTTDAVPVTFYQENHPVPADADSIGDISVIHADTQTNALGQAELTLTSALPAQAIGISARAGSHQFSISYILGAETFSSDCTDLYWIDANLYFEPDAASTAKVSTTYTAPELSTKNLLDISPTVNSHWSYEVKAAGDLSALTLRGALSGYDSVSLPGITIRTKAGSGSVGTVTGNADGRADITSAKAGYTNLVATLDGSFTGNKIKFVFSGPGKSALEAVNAGTGTSVLHKALTLNVHWTADYPTAEIIIPTGLKASIHDEAGTAVYVQVRDNSGNPLGSRMVTLNVSGAGAVINASNSASSAHMVTDSNGIAEFRVVPQGASAGSLSGLTAVLSDTGKSYTGNILWNDPSTLNPFQIEDVSYDYTAKTITLAFSRDIYAGSVIKEQFEVKYGAAGSERRQIVTDCSVDGNTVTLTLPALTTVNADDQFILTILPDRTSADNHSIRYSFASIDGQLLDTADSTVTFTSDGSIIDVK